MLGRLDRDAGVQVTAIEHLRTDALELRHAADKWLARGGRSKLF